MRLRGKGREGKGTLIKQLPGSVGGLLECLGAEAHGTCGGQVVLEKVGGDEVDHGGGWRRKADGSLSNLYATQATHDGVVQTHNLYWKE